MTAPADTLTRQVARLVARPVDAATRRAAARHVLDWAGTVVAALPTDEGRILTRLASTGPPGPCRAAGVGDRDPMTAAFTNAGLAIVLEMDDVHRAARLHPGDCVIPAALACAQATGADAPRFLDAVVRGYEAMIRIGEAMGAAHYRFWHTTATCGPFGAATAAAHLLGLGEDGLVHALGTAGTQAAGLWQCRLERVMSKPVHVGRAAQAGLLAAQLADLGLTGPAAILEGPLGLFAATAPGADPFAVTRPAGAWELTRTSLKPWAACRHAHSAIDAALGVRARAGADGLGEVVVRTYRDAITFADCPHPRTCEEAKFSLQHAVAYTLVHGEPGLDAFAPAAIADPRVTALRQRVRLEPHHDLDRAYPAHWGAEVSAGTGAGPVTVMRSDALGDPEMPMSDAMITAKARTLLAVGGLQHTAVDALVDGALALGDGGAPDAFARALPIPAS